MQMWTRLSFLQIFVNVVNAGEIVEAAERATREFCGRSIPSSSRRRAKSWRALRRTFCKRSSTVQRSLQDPNLSAEIQLILTELAAGSVETVNAAIANVFDYLLDNKETVRLALCRGLSHRRTIVRRADAHSPGAEREAYGHSEPPHVRNPEIQTDGAAFLPLLRSRRHDRRLFRSEGHKRHSCTRRCNGRRTRVSQSRKRSASIVLSTVTYTLARVATRCAGQRIDDPIAYHIALPMLRALFLNLASLPGLRRAAGPEGALKQTYPTLADSLIMRFEPT